MQQPMTIKLDFTDPEVTQYLISLLEAVNRIGTKLGSAFVRLTLANVSQHVQSKEIILNVDGIDSIQTEVKEVWVESVQRWKTQTVTCITMTDGTQWLVTETPDTVFALIAKAKGEEVERKSLHAPVPNLSSPQRLSRVRMVGQSEPRF